MVIITVIVRQLSVFDFLLILGIASMPSAGQELTYWLFVCPLLLRVASLLFSFPIWCLELDVEIDCVNSLSVAFI